MTKKIRYFGVFTTIALLVFLSLSSRFLTAGLQPPVTPGPKARAAELALEAQAGHSDGIMILGILIFIFIAAPIIFYIRGLRSAQ